MAEEYFYELFEFGFLDVCCLLSAQFLVLEDLLVVLTLKGNLRRGKNTQVLCQGDQ